MKLNFTQLLFTKQKLIQRSQSYDAVLLLFYLLWYYDRKHVFIYFENYLKFVVFLQKKIWHSSAIVLQN